MQTASNTARDFLFNNMENIFSVKKGKLSIRENEDNDIISFINFSYDFIRVILSYCKGYRKSSSEFDNIIYLFILNVLSDALEDNNLYKVSAIAQLLAKTPLPETKIDWRYYKTLNIEKAHFIYLLIKAINPKLILDKSQLLKLKQKTNKMTKRVNEMSGKKRTAEDTQMYSDIIAIREEPRIKYPGTNKSGLMNSIRAYGIRNKKHWSEKQIKSTHSRLSKFLNKSK